MIASVHARTGYRRRQDPSLHPTNRIKNCRGNATKQPRRVALYLSLLNSSERPCARAGSSPTTNYWHGLFEHQPRAQVSLLCNVELYVEFGCELAAPPKRQNATGTPPDRLLLFRT